MTLFSFIKSRIPILDVISEYTSLKKAGQYWKARCPFHHEKSASFTVSPHREIFYCFGCHASGDVISFIERQENYTPHQAAQFLIERYNLDVPSSLLSQNQTPEEIAQKDRYYNLCKQVSIWAHTMLLKNASVLAYFAHRGLSEQTIRHFNLGYFPGGLQAIRIFTVAMNNNAILVDDLLKVHILSAGKNVLFSPFEERIIFPITDSMGRFCGFGGRIFKETDTRAKYYNSRENEFFVKGSLLFGFDAAKKTIQETGRVYLVEGYTDCLVMVEHGFVNTVATLGTACTIQQLRQLSRHAQEVYVMYDGDAAGQKAMLRLTQLCWQSNMELKIVTLPAGYDPASLLESEQSLTPYLQKAQDIFLFFIAAIASDFSTKGLQEKVYSIRELLDVIKTVDDPLKQDILLQRASKLLDVPFPALKDELTRSQAARPVTETTDLAPLSVSGVQDQDSIPRLEKKIFCAIMNNMQLFNKNNEGYLIPYMPSPLQGILKRLQILAKSSDTLEFKHLFEALTDNEKQYVSKLLLADQDTISPHAFEQLLVQLHKKQWKMVTQEVKAKITLAQQAGNQVLVAEIVRDFAALKQKVLNSLQQPEMKTSLPKVNNSYEPKN
jgi:DNA primase